MKKNKKIYAPAALLLAALFFSSAFLSGCAEMEPDTIHHLKVQVKALNKETAKLSQNNTYIEKKFHDMQINIANQGVKISALGAKLRKLYGKYEVEDHNMSVLQKRFKQYRIIVNKELIKTLKNSGNEGNSGTPPASAAASSNETQAQNTSNPRLDAVNKGMKLYNGKDFTGAVSAFSKFISSYPQSKYIPKAQFYRAASNFNLKKYPVAILQFHKFSEIYPDNPNVPMAIYLQGMGFLKLSDKSDAAILFRQVISKYPDTRASKLSKEGLKKLSD